MSLQLRRQWRKVFLNELRIPWKQTSRLSPDEAPRAPSESERPGPGAGAYSARDGGRRVLVCETRAGREREKRVGICDRRFQSRHPERRQPAARFDALSASQSYLHALMEGAVVRN